MRPLTLKFTSGPHRGRTVEFTTSPVRIGRSRDNDVVLPEDLSPESSARKWGATASSVAAISSFNPRRSRLYASMNPPCSPYLQAVKRLNP